jgi:hypothetical protein
MFEVTKEDVATPLGDLEERLGALQSSPQLPSHAAGECARRCVMCTSCARGCRISRRSLRTVTDQSPREVVDLTSLVTHS